MFRPQRYALALLPIMGGALSAQEYPGKNLSVSVHVKSITRSADTVTITYLLHNSALSAERLAIFTVDGPTLIVSVSMPGPDTLWDVAKSFRGRSVAEWVALGGIQPGDTTPHLSYRSLGLPGLVPAWYSGDSIPSMFEDDSTKTPNAPLNADPLADLSNQIETVGVQSVSGMLISNFQLASRQAAIADSLCSWGWISSSGLCDSLADHLLEDHLWVRYPTRFLGFSETLDSAYSASPGTFTESAYSMLRINTDYVLNLQDLPGIELEYVCGNFFKAKSISYTTIPVHYQVFGTSYHGGLTLPARTTDSPGYSELTFETETPGTVILRYGSVSGPTIVGVAHGNIACQQHDQGY